MIIIEANNFAPDTPVTLNPGPCGRHPLYRLWRSQFEPVEDNFVINLVLRNNSRKRRTSRSTYMQTTFWEVLGLYRHTKTRKRFDLFQKGLLREKILGGISVKHPFSWKNGLRKKKNPEKLKISMDSVNVCFLMQMNHLCLVCREERRRFSPPICAYKKEEVKGSYVTCRPASTWKNCYFIFIEIISAYFFGSQLLRLLTSLGIKVLGRTEP